MTRLVPLADVPRMQRLGWWCSDVPPMDGEIWMLSDVADAADSDHRAMAKRTFVLGISDGAGEEALEPDGACNTARPTEPLMTPGDGNEY